MRHILAPDASTEAGSSSVRSPDDFRLIGPLGQNQYIPGTGFCQAKRLTWLSGDNRTKGFLGNNSGVIGWVVDDRRLNEEAFSSLYIGLTNSEFVAFGL